MNVTLIQETTRAWRSHYGLVVTQNKTARSNYISPMNWYKVKIRPSLPHFQPPALPKELSTRPNRNRARIGSVRYGACKWSGSHAKLSRRKIAQSKIGTFILAESMPNFKICIHWTGTSGKRNLPAINDRTFRVAFLNGYSHIQAEQDVLAQKRLFVDYRLARKRVLGKENRSALEVFTPHPTAETGRLAYYMESESSKSTELLVSASN